MGVSLAIQLSDLHVVVQRSAVRLTETADLAAVSAAMSEVYGWPTMVVGDERDAPYAAPTSGGPPFRGYRMTATRACAVSMADQVEPARFGGWAVRNTREEASENVTSLDDPLKQQVREINTAW